MNEPDTPKSEIDDLNELDLEAQRPDHGEAIEVKVFEAERLRGANPVDPVRLNPGDSFFFRCHRGVSCWNECCKGADITLTPIDILTLSRHLGLSPHDFLLQYTVPAEHERSGLPVAKLRMTGEDGMGPCPFVAEEGCTVYAARPMTCRYYPLGLLATKLKEAEQKEDIYFLVKEAHCKGHAEAVSQTVAEFRHEQGVNQYDDLNRAWIDIMMKMASWKTLGGPQGRDLSPQSKKMFYLVSTDVEAFRRFMFSTRFLDIYELPPDLVEAARTDDIVLLQIGFAWLKNAMFNEPTIVMKEAVLQQAIARARSELGGT